MLGTADKRVDAHVWLTENIGPSAEIQQNLSDNTAEYQYTE